MIEFESFCGSATVSRQRTAASERGTGRDQMGTAAIGAPDAFATESHRREHEAAAVGRHSDVVLFPGTQVRQFHGDRVYCNPPSSGFAHDSAHYRLTGESFQRAQ